ncbi:MAG: hypothetical protein WB217_10215 [Mesobacillus sp.]|uniref:hypothetical protein n=1 Tax=Mesobacillus sp. TaxID=2675271 RepID=UPI003C53B79B
MEKVFEEIDHDLGTFQNENNNRSRPKGKRSGMPLILAPPAIKSIQEKPASKKTSIYKEIDDQELSDFIESHDDKEYLDDFNDESLDSFNEESSIDEPSFLEEESGELLTSGDESEDEVKDVEFEHDDDETGQYLRDSDEYMYEDQESMNLVPAAYRGMDYQITCTKVRLPVHLADVDLEIDIFDTFNLSRAIASVTKVDCSLHSIDVEVLLPSANLFTKGILLLDIDYVGVDNCGAMHSVKIHIPWRKIIKVHWLHQPELSWKNNKEYMFTSPFGQEHGYHREYSESLTEKIDFHLSNLHCIWNEQFINNEKVLVQGTARMQLDLYQNQCIDLKRFLLP